MIFDLFKKFDKRHYLLLKDSVCYRKTLDGKGLLGLNAERAPFPFNPSPTFLYSSPFYSLLILKKYSSSPMVMGCSFSVLFSNDFLFDFSTESFGF